MPSLAPTVHSVARIPLEYDHIVTVDPLYIAAREVSEEQRGRTAIWKALLPPPPLLLLLQSLLAEEHAENAGSGVALAEITWQEPSDVMYQT